MSHECNFCQTPFHTIYGLRVHQNTNCYPKGLRQGKKAIGKIKRKK